MPYYLSLLLLLLLRSPDVRDVMIMLCRSKYYTVLNNSSFRARVLELILRHCRPISQKTFLPFYRPRQDRNRKLSTRSYIISLMGKHQFYGIRILKDDTDFTSHNNFAGHFLSVYIVLV